MTIHIRNLQYLAAEILKLVYFLPLWPRFSSSVEMKNFRSGQVLELRYNRTNNFGKESISTLLPKIWALVPENVRQPTSLNSFKQGIKKWNPSNCPCRLCKMWLKRGFQLTNNPCGRNQFFKNV